MALVSTSEVSTESKVASKAAALMVLPVALAAADLAQVALMLLVASVKLVPVMLLESEVLLAELVALELLIMAPLPSVVLPVSITPSVALVLLLKEVRALVSKASLASAELVLTSEV